jgi:hypothetical protein
MTYLFSKETIFNPIFNIQNLDVTKYLTENTDKTYCELINKQS